MNSPASLGTLPPELIIQILRELPASSLPALCMTCSCINELLKDDSIWRAAILPLFDDKSRLESILFQDDIMQNNPPISISPSDIVRAPFPYLSYHDLYVKALNGRVWAVGTWVADQKWNGAILEVFYKSISGQLESRFICADGVSAGWRIFSLDRQVLREDFEPVIGFNNEYMTLSKFDEVESSPRCMQGVHKAKDRFDSSEFHPSHMSPRLRKQAEQRFASTRRYTTDVENQSIPLCASGTWSEDVIASKRYTDSSGLVKLIYFRRLRPALPAPAAFKDYSGLFIGNYGSHGLEFIYLYYPTPNTLHAVKVTGDRNVPLEELTWVVDDLSFPPRICEEPEWPGARAYSARVQTSPDEFSDPEWTEAEVIFYQAKTSEMASVNKHLERNTESIAVRFKALRSITILHRP